MNLIKSTFAALAVGALTVLGGCQTYDSTSVSSKDVGQLSTVYTGTILSAQQITIRPDGSILGAATGAILGGLGGSEIGGGDKAQTAGGVAGAVLGGVLGNEIGKGVNTKKGYSYVVKINETGETREITQGGDVYLQPGTPVSIIYRQSGVTLSPASYSPGASLNDSTNCTLGGLKVSAPMRATTLGYTQGSSYGSHNASSAFTTGCETTSARVSNTTTSYPSSTTSTRGSSYPTTSTYPTTRSTTQSTTRRGSCKVVYPDGSEGPCTGEYANLVY